MIQTKKIFLFLVAITFISCNENPIRSKVNENKISKARPNPRYYVLNPNESDILCLHEIERAKTDITNGKIIFTQQYGFLFGDLRYEKELKEICKKNGLEFQHDHIGCVILEGQTQGCYGYYMDNAIINKYGVNFKNELRITADSLFLEKVVKNDLVVEYWDCDKRARLPNEKKRRNDYLPGIEVDSLDLRKEKGKYKTWPFMDLGFIVETDSTISNFHIRGFVAQIEHNEQFKAELFAMAINHMKTSYPKWVPSTIKNTPVRSDNNIRLSFSR